ncbi:MAG: monovalent cation/H+ antiporter complex subunit F [Chloroflexota bacterium]
MTGPVDGLIGIAFVTAMGMITVSLVLTFVRLVLGPSLMDRVVALELTATLVVGVVAATAIASGTPVLLDVAIALALVAFIGAVAFARYAERAARG